MSGCASRRPRRVLLSTSGALITGAARLMLALLEKSVSDAGGTYAMEDTDSIAIVATKSGGLVACEGGDHRTPTGTAVRALPWRRVDQIVKRFAALNPYARDAVPGSILKIEDDNCRDGNPKAGMRRQLYCYAISAKRFLLPSSRPCVPSRERLAART